MPVKTRGALLQQLLECVGDAELPVDDDLMAVTFAMPHRPDDFPVPAGSDGAQIVFVIKGILGRDLLRKPPIRGLGPGADKAVRELAEQGE